MEQAIVLPIIVLNQSLNPRFNRLHHIIEKIFFHHSSIIECQITHMYIPKIFGKQLLIK